MNNALSLKLANTPLLLNKAWEQTLSARIQRAVAANSIESELSKRAEAVATENHQAAYGHFLHQGQKIYRPYRVTQGVAVVPIHDVLYHKWNSISYWGTGYEGILRWVNIALIDPSVKGILFDFNSPGGMVAGCFDCVETLVSLKGKKPFWGVASDLAASAAFALYSAMDRRLITQSANVGSVGVVRAHWNYEDYLKDAGIKVTLIHAGDNKVDGNPYQDLPKSVLADFQKDAEKTRMRFAEIVSKNTGLTTQIILDTKAKTYEGQAAIDLGFSQALINGNEAVQLFADHLYPKTHLLTQPAAGVRMSDNQPAAAAAQPPESNVIAVPTIAEPAITTPAAPLATPTATITNAQPATVASSVTETTSTVQPPALDATQAERQRIQAIITHEHAQGREAMAQYLAFNTSQTVDEAVALMAVTPKTTVQNAQPQQASTGLDQVMAQVNNPVITAGTDANSSSETTSNTMMARWKTARGEKVDA